VELSIALRNYSALRIAASEPRYGNSQDMETAKMPHY
jgi:hypothetical protein